MVLKKVTSWADKFSNAIALFFLAAIVWLMAFGAWKLRSMIKEKSLNDVANLEKYGEFYESNMRDSPSNH
jgi:hypothetical protein